MRPYLIARKRWRRLYNAWYVLAMLALVVLYFSAAIALGYAISKRYGHDATSHNDLGGYREACGELAPLVGDDC
jgi:hypothetical protein